MSTEYQNIPREVNGQLDLNTVYVAAGDEFRVTVSSRMRALGIPNSRWMPVTPAMVGKIIGAEIDPRIEIRRKFTGREKPAFDLPNPLGVCNTDSVGVIQATIAEFRRQVPDADVSYVPASRRFRTRS